MRAFHSVNRIVPLEGFSLHLSESFLMKRKASVCPPDQPPGPRRLPGQTSRAVFEAAGKPFAPGFQPHNLPHTRQHEHILMPVRPLGPMVVCLIQLCIQPTSMGCLACVGVFGNVPAVPCSLAAPCCQQGCGNTKEPPQRPLLAVKVVTYLVHLALVRVPCFS